MFCPIVCHNRLRVQHLAHGTNCPEFLIMCQPWQHNSGGKEQILGNFIFSGRWQQSQSARLVADVFYPLLRSVNVFLYSFFIIQKCTRPNIKPFSKASFCIDLFVWTLPATSRPFKAGDIIDCSLVDVWYHKDSWEINLKCCLKIGEKMI